MAKNGTSSSWKFNLFYFEGSLDNDEVERKKQRRKKRRKKMQIEEKQKEKRRKRIGKEKEKEKNRKNLGKKVAVCSFFIIFATMKKNG